MVAASPGVGAPILRITRRPGGAVGVGGDGPLGPGRPDGRIATTEHLLRPPAGALRPPRDPNAPELDEDDDGGRE